MRYLILSDIHANWEALEAVLADAEGSYDRIFCCGDLVGYGGDPNRVAEWIRTHVPDVVRGNHDKACAGLEDLEWFNPVARRSAEWTLKNLTEENAGYLRCLPKGPLPLEEFDMVHGSPLDEDEYLITPQDVEQVRPYLDRWLTFFGHTHLQGGFLVHRNGVRRIDKPYEPNAEESVQLERGAAYLVNPGSVGQPRDNDWRAGYAIYTPEDRLVRYRRVPYDVSSAQAKIIEAGLPEVLADRLAAGF